MREKLVILGAGGHAAVVAEILLDDGRFDVLGFLDRDGAPVRAHATGLAVIGTDAEMARSGARLFIVGVGSVGRRETIRQRLFEHGHAAGLAAATAIHRAAVVSRSAEVGSGTAIMAGAIVNAEARIGQNVIINTGAIVEHDCVVGDHAHIAPRAVLASGVTVGEGAHVGLGACVRQGIRIGDRAVIGAGAAVVQDVAADSLVVGVPAARREG